MTTIRTFASALSAATLAAGLLAATGAAAHHKDGGGLPGNSGKAPGALIAEGLQKRPDLPTNAIINQRYFPDHPSQADNAAEHSATSCDKDIDPTGVIDGVVQTGSQDNHICTSSDIDTFTGANDGKPYVIQAGGQEAAFIITDVSDPQNPQSDGPVYWSFNSTYSPDVKAFDYDVGGNRRNYAVVALEELSGAGTCGIVIIDVTDGVYGGIVEHFQGGGQGWCNVHNLFVDKDSSGYGKQIYVTADETWDMRILDISGDIDANASATNPIEIGAYKAATAVNSSHYVHDITVVNHPNANGRRVYLAYWSSGLVVLDVNDPVNPVELIGPSSAGKIDPAGFRNHHSFPTPDGNFVFIQDEFLNSAGTEPVQMWDISNPAAPQYVDGIELGADIAVNPAHNLEIRDDIAPGRLYAGWYKMGLQAFDYTDTGFLRTGGDPDGVYHQAQTEGGDAAYDGAWGVRLVEIDGNLYVLQSDRRYGLVVDCEGDASGTDSCPGGTIGNLAPTADATTDTTTPSINSQINVVGDGSYDPDNGPSALTYIWSFIKTPKRANAAIADPDAMNTSFQTDWQGEFIVQLEVSDGLTSATDQLTINVAKSGDGGNGGGGPKNCTPDDTRPSCNK